MTDAQFFFQNLIKNYSILSTQVYSKAQVMIVVGIVLLCIFFILVTIAVFKKGKPIMCYILYGLSVAFLGFGIWITVKAGMVLLNPNFYAMELLYDFIP